MSIRQSYIEKVIKAVEFNELLPTVEGLESAKTKPPPILMCIDFEQSERVLCGWYNTFLH